MNIDRRFLDQCDLVIGPAISLAYGDDRQRVMTLSPFAVPMEQGVCLIQNPTGRLVFYGVSVSDLTLGIPECLVNYIAERTLRDGHGSWKLIGYGLGLTITRTGDLWQASLGPTPLATFTAPHQNGVASVCIQQTLGVIPSDGSQGYEQMLAALIERYL